MSQNISDRVGSIQFFIDLIDAKTYLEIGVRFGETFFPVQCENKIGVDIEINYMFEGVPNIFEMSSDEFFRNHPMNFDVAYIDGDHTYEQSLRDVENCLKWMNPNGIILLDDCNPTSPEMATPTYIGASPDWCGEVWKTIVNLRTRPSLYVAVINQGHGLGIVRQDEQVETLNISASVIQYMIYADLDGNRERLLNLV